MVDPAPAGGSRQSAGKARGPGVSLFVFGLGAAGTFFRLLAALIPLAVLAGGVIFLVNSFNAESAARAYEAALPCASAGAGVHCYRMETGIIAAANVSRGRGGDTTTLDIDLPDGRRSTWVSTSWAAEDALKVRRQVSVKLYHDRIALVVLPGFRLVARDNPVREQEDLRFAGLLFTGLGTVLSAGIAMAVWRSRRKRPAGYIEPSLPPAEQEQELRRQLVVGSIPWEELAEPVVPA